MGVCTCAPPTHVHVWQGKGLHLYPSGQNDRPHEALMLAGDTIALRYMRRPFTSSGVSDDHS
jgi:hypothetical protein